MLPLIRVVDHNLLPVLRKIIIVVQESCNSPSVQEEAHSYILREVFHGIMFVIMVM